MWNIIIKIASSMIKNKALSYVRPVINVIRIDKKFKIFGKYFKKSFYNEILQDLRRQKETLLKGSFADKVQEFASDSFLSKLFDYFDKNFDPNTRQQTKMLSGAKLFWELPLFRNMKALKRIWLSVLRDKYRQLIKIEQMEARIQELERKKQLRTELWIAKYNAKIDEQIRRKTMRRYQSFWTKSLREYYKQQLKYSKKILREKRILEQAIEREQREYLKRLKINARNAQQVLINISKQENNLSLVDLDNDIRNFKDFLTTLTDDEKSTFLQTSKETGQLDFVFDSSWIDFGVFIPQYQLRSYGEQITKEEEKFILNSNTRGFMKIQVKKPSKTNPKGVYAWWNVRYKDWKDITHHKTGKAFWDKWYRKNRKNMAHLLPQSKYWRKQRKRKKK